MESNQRESGETPHHPVVPTRVMVMACDHCERVFAIDALMPVIITGVQSYCGHLLTNKPGERHVPLCADCYVNFHSASIEGMTIKDDLEAIERIAQITGQ